METMINLIANGFLIIALIAWIEDAGDNYNWAIRNGYEHEFYPGDYLFVGFVSTYWILIFLQAFSADIR